MSDLKIVSKFMSMSQDVINIINELQSGELEVRNVPEEFALDLNVVKAERELGLRKSGHRGFDVITQNFFVEEQWFHKDLSDNFIPILHRTRFNSFEQYYNFLDGDIYENACYYQYRFDDEFSKNLNLDINRLTEIKSFVTETIDDYKCELSLDEIDKYNYNETVIKKYIKQWLDKFIACDTYDKFQIVCKEYANATVIKNIQFFFFQYALYYQYSKKHLDILMEYMSKDYYSGGNAVLGLCLIYTPEEIYNKYNFSQASPSTNRNRKANVKKFIENLKNKNIETEIYCYFDKVSHFYCEETKVYCYENRQGRRILNKLRGVTVCRAFETFEEFIKYRKGDLRNCDLSQDINLKVNFLKYIIDDTTKLPIGENTNLDYRVNKLYTNEKFIVEQFWYDDLGKCVKQKSHKFLYFFDFVAFLKGDLSGADLVLCTGMKNLSNVDGINFDNVKMVSDLCEQFNVSYTSYNYNKNLISEFPISEKYEEQTKLVLQQSREIISNSDSMVIEKYNRISYISDLHLMHKIEKAKCKSKEDMIYILQKNIDNILHECNTTITLIGGDISSEFFLFEMFVKMLKKAADKSYGKKYFVFVLGNHELWGFPELSIEQIVEKYRVLLQENGMYLLQNDLFYMNEIDDVGIIFYDELMHLNNKDIMEKLRCTRIAILGGLGFSGDNYKFNANSAVYMSTIDRNMEIKESKKLEQLYNKLIDVLSKKNTVILTHMPKQDWCNGTGYHDNFVYVSGHTHWNEFFDDGVVRIYSDNQIGYRNQSLHLKNFLIDKEYDYFADYDDGIYEITAQQYQDFARGKNLNMTFNRQINILYMLKKKGYYCFIHKSKTGTLSLLNGGSLKNLYIQRLKYYYENMDIMIDYIKKPLDKYIAYQQNISDKIKKIGGSGRIHGCIIDIDFFNHIYVNPVNMAITGYWAKNIIDKQVFVNIPGLLKSKCPVLYCNYMKLVEEENANSLIINNTENEALILSQEYLETDIYRASREMKKMQKLSSNVLTVWYDTAVEAKKCIHENNV